VKIKTKDQPRLFDVNGITIRDFGKIGLGAWEMVSVVTESRKECDITVTDWGIYLGSSLNGRLKKEGFKVALVLNEGGKVFVNAVDTNKIDIFEEYVSTQKSKIVCWLDEWVDSD
jgi:hypothetical protein